MARIPRIWMRRRTTTVSLYRKTLSFLAVGSVDKLASESGRKPIMHLPAIDMAKYASLKVSLEDHRRPESSIPGDSSNTFLDPSDLYQGAFDQA